MNRIGAGRLPTAEISWTIGLVVMLLAWLWPIGLGGQMPVGGDVTQFFLGLMGVLHTSLEAGAWPIWNDRWGFGFPGLAESQMGVYYPPHWILYGAAAPEVGYLLSMMAHTLWGGLGMFWASRRLGLSRPAAALAGFAWSASGFFLIHLSHQWGYTNGSWMPWAVGLAWLVLYGDGRSRIAPALGLAAILAIQVLPGHFQIAFMTQVVVLGAAMWSLIDPDPAVGGASRWRRAGLVVLAWLTTIPLATAQLWPTWTLARLAEDQRTVAYLADFAASPLHLISYLVPEAFRVSPLWRPVVWDTFHTSPEEHLGYVGLVPLGLACLGVFAGIRRDRLTRMLLALTLLSGLFSLGPYVPGFSWLVEVPGFSFFRAPARWGLVVALGLAWLAGRGLDAWLASGYRGQSMRRLAVVGLALIGIGLVVTEALIAGGRGPIPSAFDPMLAGILERSPWEESRLDSIREAAAAPRADLRVLAKLARFPILGDGLDVTGGLALLPVRGTVYLWEFGPPAVTLLTVVLLSPLMARGRGWATALVMLLTFGDLVWLGWRHKPFDTAPIGRLADRSGVLGGLEALPFGTRTITPAMNLPMLVGATSTNAYRTLDLPGPPALVAVLTGGPADPRWDAQTFGTVARWSDTPVHVLDAGGLSAWDRAVRSRGGSDLGGTLERIDDPEFAAWIFGRDLVESDPERFGRFGILRLPRDATYRAWGLSPSASALTAPLTPDVLRSLRSDVRPLEVQRLAADVWDVRIPTETADAGGSIDRVLVAILAHPNWSATWLGDPTATRDPSEPALAMEVRDVDGWLVIGLPEGVRSGTLRLRYDGSDALVGLAVSGVAWALWGTGLVAVVVRGRVRNGTT